MKQTPALLALITTLVISGCSQVPIKTTQTDSNTKRTIASVLLNSSDGVYIDGTDGICLLTLSLDSNNVDEIYMGLRVNRAVVKNPDGQCEGNYHFYREPGSNLFNAQFDVYGRKIEMKVISPNAFIWQPGTSNQVVYQRQEACTK